MVNTPGTVEAVGLAEANQGLGVGLQRLKVTPWAGEYDAAMLGGPVGVDVVRADVFHRKLLYRR